MMVAAAAAAAAAAAEGTETGTAADTEDAGLYEEAAEEAEGAIERNGACRRASLVSVRRQRRLRSVPGRPWRLPAMPRCRPVHAGRVRRSVRWTMSREGRDRRDSV